MPQPLTWRGTCQWMKGCSEDDDEDLGWKVKGTVISTPVGIVYVCLVICLQNLYERQLFNDPFENNKIQNIYSRDIEINYSKDEMHIKKIFDEQVKTNGQQ